MAGERPEEPPQGPLLIYNERNILTHAGTVSHQLAEDHAHAEFARYEARPQEEWRRPMTTEREKRAETPRLDAATAANLKELEYGS